MKVLTAEKVRQIDKACEEIGLPTGLLMENAGKAVAEEVVRIMDGVVGRNLIILAGPGNNGGDGLVAARHLDDRGANVSLYLFRQRNEDDSNYRLVKESDIACTVLEREADLEKLDNALASADAVIDSIFGTGNNRPLEGIFAEALIKAGEARKKNPELRVIAVDLPSGLNADTGAVDPACLRADDTVTLAYPKVGLYCPPGLEYAGNITVADIGIPGNMADDVNVQLINSERVYPALPIRPLSANKGSFGKVLVVAGSINYIGAAYLACSAAMRVGAGLVTLAIPAGLQPALASKLVETTYLPLPEIEPGELSSNAVEVIRNEIGNYNTLLIGCGLGQSEHVKRLVDSLLLESGESLPQTIIDADALNILSGTAEWWKKMKGDAVITPHPGEMARLLKTTVEEVQADRVETAGKAAREWGKTVVLKGACTVIASPGGKTEISPLANPGLATAGTGDILAGAIAGLAAQGLNTMDAAVCGVYLHGEAGEAVRERIGDMGMIAGDLLPELPLMIKRLKENIIG